MLNFHSPITLDSKILIYTMLLRPIWQHGAWHPQHRHSRYKDFRTGSYLSLGTLGTIQYTDLNMTDVSTTINKTYTKLHLTMREHVNPLIQDTVQHLPPPRITKRLKRRHHANNLEPTDE
jgi:hypothetical protein